MVAPLITQPVLGQLNNLGFGFPPKATFELGTYLNLLTNVAVGFNVVFRPGSPLPLPVNVYDTWATAFAALQAVSGNRQLLVDSTLATAIVPAGVWDFETTIVLKGLNALPMETLIIADGATLVNLHVISGIISLISVSSTPVLNVAAGVPYALTLDIGAGIQANGTAPFIRVAPLGDLELFLFNGGSLFADTSAAIDILALGTCNIYTLNPRAVIDDTISGAVTAVLNINVGDPDASIATVQTGFGGTYALVLLTDAVHLGYTPTTPGDWSGSPVQTRSALDRIAASVAGLIPGPIP